MCECLAPDRIAVFGLQSGSRAIVRLQQGLWFLVFDSGLDFLRALLNFSVRPVSAWMRVSAFQVLGFRIWFGFGPFASQFLVSGFQRGSCVIAALSAGFQG